MCWKPVWGERGSECTLWVTTFSYTDQYSYVQVHVWCPANTLCWIISENVGLTGFYIHVAWVVSPNLTLSGKRYPFVLEDTLRVQGNLWGTCICNYETIQGAFNFWDLKISKYVEYLTPVSNKILTDADSVVKSTVSKIASVASYRSQTCLPVTGIAKTEMCTL
jgi:hypothetical protein